MQDYFSFTGSWAYNPDGYIFEIISCGELCRNRSNSLAGESARLLPVSSLHLDFFCNRTSADEKFPVVVTELTFPSVAVESVPFAIQTGETVDCYVLPQQKLDSCSKNVIYNRGKKFLGRLQIIYTVVTCNFEDVFFTDALQFSLPTLYTVKRPE